MIRMLHLQNVGPAAEMKLELAPRLNILTGDNGLGKSFLLDIAWWALSGRWPAEDNPKLGLGKPPRPSRIAEGSLEFLLSDMSAPYAGCFDRDIEKWLLLEGRPVINGLALYALADDGFAVWDPRRRHVEELASQVTVTWTPATVFAPGEVWDAWPPDRKSGSVRCNGLISDWAGWQKERGDTFELLKSVLAELSPNESERLTPGKLTRISVNDSRDMPTVSMPYAPDVPLVHASSAIRRVASLAYLLAWAWQEHQYASELKEEPTAKQLVFLIDEIEAHLHPRWQRTIVRSLLTVVERLAPEVEVQLIATTHSPLVMASIEPLFDGEQDAWFDLDLVHEDGQAEVRLEKRPWVRYGDASRWLTSEAFNLLSAGSIERQQVLEEAAEALGDEKLSATKAKQIERRLRDVLGVTDPFWGSWLYIGEKRGWLK